METLGIGHQLHDDRVGLQQSGMAGTRLLTEPYKMKKGGKQHVGLLGDGPFDNG